jgi:hypothetical protein
MGPMLNRVMDSFWRALAYCLLPRVIGLSLLPLVVAGVLAFGFMFLFWESAIAAVRATLEHWMLIDSLLRWLDSLGLQAFRSALAPMVLLALMLPAVIALSLLLVALWMTPAMVRLVADRRFPTLEKRQGSSLLGSVLASLVATLLALILLVGSMPFWLIPPLVLILPPLIWGWLTYRVFGYDVLALHASPEERRRIMREHRWPMLLIGVVSGYLGAAPTLIFTFNVVAVMFAPFLILLSVWLYTLVFAFSSAWFAHYALSALAAQRHTAEVIEA